MGFFKTKAQKLAEREAREKAELANRIRAQAKEQAVQWIKIVNDCAELVNTTKKPEVFFPRYNLMLEHLEMLAGIECTGIFNNSKELPSQIFLRIEESFPAETQTFIDRSFEAAKGKADTLKTAKGKKNAILRYFDDMDKHIIYMPIESVDYLEELKNRILGEI